MPFSASWALQKGIYDALAGDPALTGLLGGNHIYDDVPQNVKPPFVIIGQSSARDWSTGSERGTEHHLTFHVWSRGAGHKETQSIISAIQSRLHDNELTLLDHHLVNLREEMSDMRRETDGEHYHGVVRYRAVTEPQ